MLATLHTFAQALPDVVSPHAALLAPLLKGSPLLTGRASAAAMCRVAATLEVIIAVTPEPLAPSTLASLQSDLIGLVVKSSFDSLVMEAAAAALGVLVTVVTLDDSAVRRALSRVYSFVHNTRARLRAAALAAVPEADRARLSAGARRWFGCASCAPVGAPRR